MSERADDGSHDDDPRDPGAPSARSRRYLDAARRAREGRLKVYLGPAAGVGKTYRMLQEAHELKRRGVDVVIGYVETHGRAETEALVHGLEQVPLRKLHYRGLDLHELDVDAVLKRAPKVVLVDELAHTNAPGSMRRRRFEDVLALLRAGIDVIGALNVQHLESLNDVVLRATGTRVRETVPDSFLKRADEIVDVDLPPEDLLARLRAGKVYDGERATWALANFFKPENLTVLRELALREVAESLERSTAPRSREADGAVGRLMVCLSSRSPRTRQLLRHASRMAGRLNTHWFAVYVRTPSEAPDRIDATTRRIVADAADLARELGAEVMVVESSDPVVGILDFAASHGVRDIVIGASSARGWRAWLRRTVPERLVREAAGYDVHILGADEPRRTPIDLTDHSTPSRDSHDSPHARGGRA